MESRAGGIKPWMDANTLDIKTILILFVALVIVFIYLFALLLVVIRRAKKLIELHNRRYYFVIAFYIVSKLIICVVLGVEVIYGWASQWANLTGDDIETMIKTAIVLADLSIIELFLISLENYFKLSLSTLHDMLSRKQSRYITLALQGLQVVVVLVLVIPLFVFEFDSSHLSYNIINGMGLGLNLLVLISFLVTFFYLNFKMTGVMMQARLNEVIRRVYKVQLIILVSRAFMITFQLMLAIFVTGTFQNEMDILAQSMQQEAVLALTFIGSILFILMTEGLPVMYSLRSSVVQSLNYKTSVTEHKQNLESSLVENINESEQRVEGTKEMRLKNFSKLTDLTGSEEDGEEAIWICKKGYLQGKSYLIRISKHEISSYIFEDIDNEISLWNQINVKALSRLSYFCEGDIIHLVERFYNVGLDQRVDEITGEKELLRLGVQVADAIRQLHQNQIIHGCISPRHVFLEGGQVVLNGCGLHSMRKYLSLITGYTNKTMYTAVEHLRDKNNVILKPQKAADVYSFGIILYEIVTKNRQYRQLGLREVQTKFADENFRPKLPEQIRVEVKNLIRRCWHESPERRPEMEEVIDMLRRYV